MSDFHYSVTAVIDQLEYFDADVTGISVHGANLNVANLVRGFAADPRVDRYDIFLPPRLFANTEGIAKIAQTVLPPERQGRGILGFYPIHQIPEMWSDGRPRILFTIDPDRMPDMKYLRDRYATGPMPIICDTHCHGIHRVWQSYSQLAGSVPVEYDSIALLTESYRESFRRTFDGFLAPDGAPLFARLDVIPHGVDTEWFKPVDDAGREQARRLLRLPTDGIIAGFLSRCTPYTKGDIVPLVRAFANMTSETPTYLLLAGSEGIPGYYDRIRRAAAQYDVTDQLIIRPEVPAAFRTAYFSAMDFFVFPGDTMHEGQATVNLEAMAAGLPLVISDWDGPRDFVVHGETGFKVETTLLPADERISALSPLSPFGVDFLAMAQMVHIDSQQLTDAMDKLAGSAQLRAAMGAAGRKRAEQHFSWRCIFDKWAALAEELLAVAAKETLESKARRRAAADALGRPTDYIRMFGHYGTRVLDLAASEIQITDFGRASIGSDQPIEFYDELLPLIHEPTMAAIFEVLCNNALVPLGCKDLIAEIAKRTGQSESDVAFHIGLLFKQDLVSISSPSSGKSATKA